MTKLVVLKVGQGSFNTGFPVTLQIGEEGQRPSIEVEAQLPPRPEIPRDYQCWQSHYAQLDALYRLSAPAQQQTNVSFPGLRDQCLSIAQSLQVHLNDWLRTEEYRPIWHEWLKRLQIDEPLRVILQTQNLELQRLPWHFLDMFEGYHQAEIAVGASFHKTTAPVSRSGKVHILAILGDSRGIDTQADRRFLEQLPDAEVTLLVEPDRQTLTQQLWRQSWDILFFAGHSASQRNCESGVIYLNQTDTLTIGDLKYTLSKAINQGLQLAIFNSCDGLGLGRELAELHIPQVILMREPVPDRVAQAFLKSFLAAYAQGESLYLAVRQAREQLEGLQNQFPCATWLPIIFQNLAAQPPTWRELAGQPESWLPLPSPLPSPAPLPPRSRRPSPLTLTNVLLTSVAVTTVIAGVRHLGWLEPWELKAYDHLMQARSIVQPEKPDDRILVLEVDDSTYASEKAKHKKLGDKSLSDESLVELIELLEKHQPAAIGLDLQRDAKGVPNNIVSRLQKAKKLFGICFRPHPNIVGFPPPLGIPPDNIGFADFILDSQNHEVRRHLLYGSTKPNPICDVQGSLSLQLALTYLKNQKGIAMETVQDPHSAQEYMQLGQVTFRHLDGRPGGYQQERNLDHLGGSQVLLNYRDVNIQAVPVVDVLQGRLQDQDIRDRIILIGVTRRDGQGKDLFHTPYSRGTAVPGVFVHAQMVSQVLSAVFSDRPLLQVWSGWIEILWIGGWGLAAGLILWQLPTSLYRWLGLAAIVILLHGGCLYILVRGDWVPLVPCSLAIVLISGSIGLYEAFAASRQVKVL